jgi:hypothetical protein
VVRSNLVSGLDKHSQGHPASRDSNKKIAVGKRTICDDSIEKTSNIDALGGANGFHVKQSSTPAASLSPADLDAVVAAAVRRFDDSFDVHR